MPAEPSAAPLYGEMRVATVRLRCAASGAEARVAARRAVERELAGADLGLPGLPPAAVLVVRRLEDPLPGGLGRGGFRPAAAWERSVRERLGQRLRAAARPDARGRVPPESAAVLFADGTELTACLVRAFLHGERPWWAEPLPRTPTVGTGSLVSGDPPSGPSRVALLLAARPREVPAVLGRLAAWGEETRVLAALGEAGARRLLDAVVDAYGLPVQLAGRTGPPDPDASSPAPGPSAKAPRPSVASVVDPWAPWTPSAAGRLPISRAARALLGVCFGLLRSPARLRSGETVRAATRWWLDAASDSAPAGWETPAGTAGARQSVTSPPARPERNLRESLAGAGAASLGRDGTDGAAGPSPRGSADEAITLPLSTIEGVPHRKGPELEGESGALPVRKPRLLPEEAPGPRPGQPREMSPDLSSSGPHRADGQAPSGLIRAGLRSAQAPAGPPEPASADAPRNALPQSPESDAVEPDPSPPALFEESLTTAWGGVLYLIHLLAELDLPEAFEAEWRLASTAGPWGCLDLVARGLLAHRFPAAAGDALWPALGRLAGWQEAEDDRPDETLPPYRLPVAWWPRLDGDGDDLSWAAGRSRLAVASAAGFLLADVPRTEAPPSAQARSELERFPGLEREQPLRRRSIRDLPTSDVPPLPRGCPDRLGPWLERTLPTLRRRLLLALRPNGGADPLESDPIERLLAVPAHLHLTPTHVDLVAALDAIRLPARAAGLDRDPGWRPELGRVVRFHFT